MGPAAARSTGELPWVIERSVPTFPQRSPKASKTQILFNLTDRASGGLDKTARRNSDFDPISWLLMEVSGS